jgi:hypothetical protein
MNKESIFKMLGKTGIIDILVNINKMFFIVFDINVVDDKIYLGISDTFHPDDIEMDKSYENLILSQYKKTQSDENDTMIITKDEYDELIKMSPKCPNCGMKPFIESKGCTFCGYKIKNKDY